MEKKPTVKRLAFRAAQIRELTVHDYQVVGGGLANDTDACPDPSNDGWRCEWQWLDSRVYSAIKQKANIH